MEAQLITGLPPSCYYLPNFITAEDETQILREINRLPQARWTVLTHRRLLSLPTSLTGTKRDTLLESPLPPFLTDVASSFANHEVFGTAPHKGPNHVLINEYKPGEGIMPHEDGPAYHPLTATVSLGAHCVLEIYRKNADGEREANPSWRILQEPRSLLITSGDMYSETLHGISEIEVDTHLDKEHIANWDLLGNKAPYASGQAERSTRMSLTFRDVVKVAKVGGAMKFMSKK